MNIAIVGAGISGIYAAHYLAKKNQVTLFEANSYLGGHTDTQHLLLNDQSFAVDTGFIVYNQHNYPFFCRFINELKVSSQPTDMTFSVSDATTGLEYNATTMDKLFCQRSNVFSPKFYRMILDIIRFYKQAGELLNSDDDELTLGEYLQQNHYSQFFIDNHMLPMACALWSGPPNVVEKFPARYLVAFLNNHQMLQINERPQWRTILGGSHSYVKAFQQQFKGTIRLNSPVKAIHRDKSGVTISTTDDDTHFDQLILACHSDQAFNLLKDPSTEEAQILGAITYQLNDTVLHTDRSLMPKHSKAWASWNALKLKRSDQRCTVTYYMNLLQTLETAEPLLVTLNCTDLIDPEKILAQRAYHHPVYTPISLAAQKRRQLINGKNRTYYAGAYWGWGFHEDGAKSAQEVVDLLNTVS